MHIDLIEDYKFRGDNAEISLVAAEQYLCLIELELRIIGNHVIFSVYDIYYDKDVFLMVKKMIDS